LPAVLLLLDYWPLRRSPLGALVKEKIPFFVLSALSAAVTLVAQKQSGAMKTLDAIPLGSRIGNALVSYANYIGKMFWPADLAMLYPFPGSIPLWQVSGAFLLLVLFSALAIGYRRRRPYLVTGWFWFLATLVPVIGLVQVGGQSMADRYTYLPLTGLFLVLAWGSDDLLQGWRYRKAVLAVLAAGIVAASSAGTWRQVGYWKDNLTLYRHTLEVTDGNYLILNNYGVVLAQEGRLDEAITQYQEALRVWPRAATAHVNLGDAFAQQGRFAEAIRHYQRALGIVPDYALALENMGKALAALGRDDEAAASYEQTLRFDPSRSGAHLNLAILLVRRGRVDEGWRHYVTALTLEPYSAKLPINMGVALAQQGLPEEAAGCFRQALRIDPASVEAHFNLGVVLARQNRVEEAAYHFSEVLRWKPDAEGARRWLEVLKRQR
jgi:tetratricopeptide (TPR) repeat protein